jgi:hypothetical protein
MMATKCKIPPLPLPPALAIPMPGLPFDLPALPKIPALPKLPSCPLDDPDEAAV